MSPYVALLGARFRLLLQYRAAALAGLTTQPFFGLVRVMTYEGLYAGVSAPQPMTLPEVVSYVWLGQAMFELLPWRVDREVAALIKNGNLAYELLRPLDLYATWFARSLASRVAPTMLRAGPLLLVAALALGLRAPASAASGVAFAASLLGGVILGSAISVLVTLSLLWTVGDGAFRMLSATVLFACGMILPIPLMPGWAVSLFTFLPFADVADKPFRLYTGQLAPEALGGVLLHQLVWTVGLVLLGRALLGRGLRQVVVAGG